MTALRLFLPFFLLLLIRCPIIHGSTKVACSSDLCALSEPFIRFPFRLRDRQDQRCGYPGFDLSCDGRNRTIIDLPQLGEFKVEMVDYIKQTVLLTDPHDCLLGRLHEFDSLKSILRPSTYTRSITLLNCSNDFGQESWRKYFATCLSGVNYTVMAIPTDQFEEDFSRRTQGCMNRTVLVPSNPNWSDRTIEFISLAWDRPACGSCVKSFNMCRIKNEKTLEVTCDNIFQENSPGRSKWKTIVVVVVIVTIPSILVVLGISFYVRLQVQGNAPRNGNLVSASARDGQLQQQERQTIESRANGLDAPAIASYPTIQIGESTTQLPDPRVNTCAICLLDYREQDTVKIMPECDHYFHDYCVDEWLKRQATCPLCRKQQPRQQIVSLND